MESDEFVRYDDYKRLFDDWMSLKRQAKTMLDKEKKALNETEPYEKGYHAGRHSLLSGIYSVMESHDGDAAMGPQEQKGECERCS